MKKSIVVTGANGFVGKNLLNRLSANGIAASPLSRASVGSEFEPIADISPYGTSDELIEKLKGAHAVIHLGARAHVLNDSASDALSEFRKANTVTTLHLANLAARSNLKRFIFVSSIGVNGSGSTTPFVETSLPSPIEAYAISKLEAEQGLREIAVRTGMEVVIVRPPLVYGPNCPGNFLRLLDLVYKGLPLPIGAVNNQRSIIGVHNLADFLVQCALHPAAANKTFLIADRPDISTPNLMRTLAEGMDRPCRLVSVPYGMVRGAASLVGKQGTLDKLCGTLQVDSTFARQTLRWTEPLSLRDGLLETGRWYAQMKAEKSAS